MGKESVVLAHEQVRLHDAERVERHTDDNQKRRATEERSDRPRNLHRTVENLRKESDDEKPRSADKRDARHHRVEIFGGGDAGTDAGKVGAVLLEVFGNVDRVELRRHPEEGEEHDERGIDHEMHGATHVGQLHEEAAEPAHGARRVGGDVAGEEAGDLEDRLRKDDRHDARVVDAQRHERLLHAV